MRTPMCNCKSGKLEMEINRVEIPGLRLGRIPE
jgi:hypothetical protein